MSALVDAHQRTKLGRRSARRDEARQHFEDLQRSPKRSGSTATRLGKLNSEIRHKIYRNLKNVQADVREAPSAHREFLLFKSVV